MSRVCSSLIACLFVMLVGAPALAQSAPQQDSALVAASDQYVGGANSVLRYKAIGQGEPVILLHGFAQRLETQAPLAATLASKHRVIAMDFRGFGESGKSADPADFGQALVDDVIRLMDAESIERAHIVGHSMGAVVAANLAARFPDRLASVTMIAGPFYESTVEVEREMADDLSAGRGMVGFIQFATPGVPLEIARQVSDQIVAGNDVPSMVAALEGMAELREVTSGSPPRVRALIVCGERDPVLPNSRRLAAWWTGATLLEIPSADHISVLAESSLSEAVEILIGS